MFSHVTVGCSDIARASRFYDALLIPIGLRQRVVKADGGPPAACWVDIAQLLPRFYVYVPFDGMPSNPGNGCMVAFLAPSTEAVDTAYAAGLATGGTDEGAPGLRIHYEPDYYGAYLRDPDGNKVHIVHRSILAKC
jgi:catechol 2,3-dioxygenase-like lactoylglutathione lyase family enzyme